METIVVKQGEKISYSCTNGYVEMVPGTLYGAVYDIHVRGRRLRMLDEPFSKEDERYEFLDLETGDVVVVDLSGVEGKKKEKEKESPRRLSWGRMKGWTSVLPWAMVVGFIVGYAFFGRGSW